MGIFSNSGPLLISTCITVLICGAVLYFCTARLNNIEQAVQTQNKVLSDFIFNVQADLRNGGGGQRQTTQLSSPEARTAVAELLQKNNGKITVSDDDEDDDDDDEISSESDDDESNDESSSEESDEEGQLKEVQLKEVQLKEVQMKEVQIQEIQLSENIETIDISIKQPVSLFENTDNMQFIKLIELDPISPSQTISTPTNESESEDEESSDDDVDEKIIITKLPSRPLAPKPALMTTPTPAQVVPVPAPVVPVPQDVPLQTRQQLEAIKVDDLRKLAVERNLTTKENARKLKKNEILALFP
jgi:hypothetical protein